MSKFKSALLASAVSLSAGGVLSANVAQAEPLNVYTYDSFVSEWGPGPKLEAAFEAQCNCDVNFIAVDDGVSILNRLRVEGKKNKADIIMGLDDALMEETRATGLIAEHKVKLPELRAELNWQDKQFVPFDMGYFAFVYDADKIAEPVTSLRELINSDASVIYQDPRTSTPGQGLMMWVESVYGDESEAAWKQLSQHTVTVTKGWWEAYSMFLEGGADYVLSYTTSPAYHAVVEEKNNYKAAAFSEGHVAQVEVAAVLNTSKQPELAQQFLQFMVSPEAQEILPVTNWMLPVAKNTELPEVFGRLANVERIGFTSEEVAKQRKSWIREWRSAAAK
ncbi:thiamine ABC transporter substrate binding subunit [Aliamphritea hakodatensis]|uniref:thiamine ABC transporter substrate binding subunit n=1 Tax=Aliamphritea hakodatensis TaxID=2895352 RepID=UPI0022FD94FB|nr:thiamine ABC transporter substrate binding subunit [Aliamphritea hakodatensis]